MVVTPYARRSRVTASMALLLGALIVGPGMAAEGRETPAVSPETPVETAESTEVAEKAASKKSRRKMSRRNKRKAAEKAQAAEEIELVEEKSFADRAAAVESAVLVTDGPADGGNGVFSLLEVYQTALEKDPVLRGALFRHHAVKHVKRAAKAGFFPTIDYSYEDTQTNQRILRTGNPLFTPGTSIFPTKFWRAELSQSLLDLATIHRWKQAEVELEQADAELAAAQQDLIIRVAQRYTQVLASQDSLKFARLEEEALQSHYNVVKEKLASGLTTEADVLESEARIAEVEAARVAAENSLEDAIYSLREATGVETPVISGLAEKIPLDRPDPQDPEFWVQKAQEQNLELLFQEKSTEVARREVKRRQAGYYPKVDFVARQSNRESGGTIFGGGNEIENSEFVFRADVPIWDGGLTTARTREANDLFHAEEAELEQRKRAVNRQVRSAYAGITHAVERVESLSRSVIAQERVLETRLEGFESGLYTNLAVLDAKRDVFRARRDYAQARYEYLVHSLLLNQAVGTLDVEDVQRVNSWLDRP